MVAHGDAVVTPNPDEITGAGHRRGLGNHDTRDPGTQQVFKSGGRLKHVSQVDLRDGIADLPAARRTGLTGHHDVVEPEELPGQLEVDHVRFTGSHRHVHGHRPIADALGAQSVLARRKVEHGEAPVVRRRGSQIRTDDVYLGRADEGTGPSFNDGAGNGPALLGSGRPGDKQQRQQRQDMGAQQMRTDNTRLARRAFPERTGVKHEQVPP